jgi:hypothetical protein
VVVGIAALASMFGAGRASKGMSEPDAGKFKSQRSPATRSATARWER